MLCLPGKADTRLSASAKSSHHTISDIREKRRLPGRNRRRLRRISMVISVWAQSVTPAHAALVYDTSIVSFSDSASVTDK